jgi:trimeric autotransporter adhesin
LATNTLLRQDPTPNAGMLRQVGRLDPSFMFTATAGFDILGGDNGLALAVLQRTGGTPASTAAQSSLYRVDLVSGQLTLIGDLGPAANPLLVGSLALRFR